MAIATDDITVIAPTSVEAKAARKYCGSLRVVRSGIALADLKEMPPVAAISFGVAGGLRPDLETGTVLVPAEVRTADGRSLFCDPELVALLRAGAAQLGYTPVSDPILTSSKVVTGAERAAWAARGFSGVDMESAFLRSPRVAVARVILDTPLHELSPQWVNPARALLNPANWPQALWLVREAPRCAELAARVIAAAFS
jgi:hypothetical protein